MVSGGALRICLDHPDVTKVTAMGHRPTGIDYARLREVVMTDFTDFTTSDEFLDF